MEVLATGDQMLAFWPTLEENQKMLTKCLKTHLWPHDESVPTAVSIVLVVMFRSPEGMTKLVGKYGGVEGPLVEVPDGEDGDAAVVEHWVLVADAHLFSSS